MAMNLNSRSFLNTISHYKLGLIGNKSYKENVIATQINRIPQEPQRFEDMDRIINFKYVRTNTEGDLLGINMFRCKVYRKTKVISRIYVMRFTYNPFCMKGPNNRNSLLSSLKTKRLLRECIQISDTADVHFNGKNPLLFAGNCYNEGMAGLTYFNCEGKNLDYEWRVPGQTFCCTACNFSQQFALGCEEGYYLFNTVRMGEKRVINHENVLSLQFSNDGNFLVLCTDKNGVSICDVRDHECFRRNCSIKKEFGSSCKKRYAVDSTMNYIQEIKLLNDQTYLVIEDTEGYLEKVDLRMMKTVMHYEGHAGHRFRRCICLNEDLDLICAPGADKVIRIWSLSSGKLNYEKRVFDRNYSIRNDDPPHCSFLTNQRRWFLSVLQDDMIIPVAPTDEFPDLSEVEKANILCR